MEKLTPPTQTHGLTIKQERGQVTYDRLISTGFKMLELRELQDISIAELTKEAGYSVGAFYSRFRSKDEFFDALIAKHLETRSATQVYLFATLPPETLVTELVHNIVSYYLDRRKFWRAVLVRSVKDDDFWEPIHRHGEVLRDRFRSRLKKDIGRELTAEEQANVNFAFLILLGAINSTIINYQGPVQMGEKLFIDELTRAFRLISGYDELKPKGLKRAR
ncbi:MAG TPA: TetR/AcrR family transcriptional regulator [Candidatus Acidoferrum sp.]|nr:TetR/AcrR family transcriptional regulator [Candidatus Acidoferrum sp.]